MVKVIVAVLRLDPRPSKAICSVSKKKKKKKSQAISDFLGDLCRLEMALNLMWRR